jgi:hypothetical protein
VKAPGPPVGVEEGGAVLDARDSGRAAEAQEAGGGQAGDDQAGRITAHFHVRGPGEHVNS